MQTQRCPQKQANVGLQGGIPSGLTAAFTVGAVTARKSPKQYPAGINTANNSEMHGRQTRSLDKNGAD